MLAPQLRLALLAIGGFLQDAHDLLLLNRLFFKIDSL